MMCNDSRKQFGLIVAPSESPAPVQRHRYNRLAVIGMRGKPARANGCFQQFGAEIILIGEFERLYDGSGRAAVREKGAGSGKMRSRNAAAEARIRSGVLLIGGKGPAADGAAGRHYAGSFKDAEAAAA